MKPSGNCYVWPEEEDITERTMIRLIVDSLSQCRLMREREQYHFTSYKIDKAKKLM